MLKYYIVLKAFILFPLYCTLYQLHGEVWDCELPNSFCSFAGWWQLNKTSIIIDASKYIQELKQKVEELNRDVANAQTSTDQNSLPMVFSQSLQLPHMCSFQKVLLIWKKKKNWFELHFLDGHKQVTVEVTEKGFLIDVFSAKSCPGLFVSILESFEEMSLNVLEARATCMDTFRFHAVGEKVRYNIL